MEMLARWWFAGLLAHAFLLQAIVILLRIAITYEAVSIGLDVFLIGVIGGAFGALPAVLALHTGRYIDLFGERTVLAVGSLTALVASVGLWLTPASFGSLLILSAVAGVAQLVGVSGHHSATAKSAGGRQASRFGHLTMFVSLAHMAGPIIFSLIAGRQSVPETGTIFAFASLSSLLLLFLTVFVKPPRRAGSEEVSGLWKTAASIGRTKGFRAATITSMVLFSATDLLLIYLPLFGAEQGFSATTVGFLLALRGAAAVVSRLFFGQLYHNIKRDKLLLLALVSSGGAIALIPLVSSSVGIGCLVSRPIEHPYQTPPSVTPVCVRQGSSSPWTCQPSTGKSE